MIGVPGVLLACLFLGELAGVLYEPFGYAARACERRMRLLAREREAEGENKPQSERQGIKPRVVAQGAKPRAERQSENPRAERQSEKPRVVSQGEKPRAERQGIKPHVPRLRGLAFGNIRAKRLALGAASAAFDVLFFVLCGVLYTAFAAAFRFPSFRPYMALAAVCGFALWRGSLRRTLAFLYRKLYNRVRSGRSRKMRAARPSGYDEGRKI